MMGGGLRKIERNYFFEEERAWFGIGFNRWFWMKFGETLQSCSSNGFTPSSLPKLFRSGRDTVQTVCLRGKPPFFFGRNFFGGFNLI